MIRRLVRSTATLFLQGLAVELTYRIALIQTIFSEIIGMVGLAFFWIAAGRSDTANAYGYSPHLLMTYFIIAGFMSLLAEDGLSHNVSFDIRTGKLSAALLRPFPYIVRPLARSAALVVVRLAIIAPIGAVLIYYLSPNAFAIIKSGHWGKNLLAIALAILIGWSIKCMVGFLAFKMTETWGPELIFLSLSSLASGHYYPSDILPAQLFTVATWTPVFYMIGFPTLAIMHKFSAGQFEQLFGRGCLVACLTIMLANFVWRRGMREFEAIGI